MNRRAAVSGLLAAGLLAVPASTSAQNDSAPRCTFMEERDGAFVLEGRGEKLTEPFSIEPGRYRLEAVIDVPSGEKDSLAGYFYEVSTGDNADSFSTSSSDIEFSTSVDLRDGSEYVFEARMVDSGWKIVLSPI